ncbi:MAG: GNAT family N-acetyltransferase [SAR202 cluster bacterium]|jgi:putative acetyltransferase|nr:GNAT family N-acetyltransferase [SAR202 cluster bacterium]MDP6663408.1 GNAT family N-acetyltransferase [SAR202 cluster bacterium]MQG59279.1 GNAT family N-acetyltransferase [SAR202 cluster bacterium]MQG69667.1 GNAT family N-acetyltransferase [SAR202 cluster bacterium]HAL46149.1 GNAT family N-acetyltransferase [Dehalococcoidia bacterium]|tara:strand:+ start:4875 stop:5363 length:489 start_codon:yes stop_codon:yes gene_type:complete
MQAVVRASRADDYKDVYDVYTCPGVMRNTAGLPYVSLDYWHQRMSSASPGEQMLVAEIDGRVVASINLHCGRNRMAHTARFSMGVHDDFQGKGIGRQLMEAMLDLSEQWLNIRRIELQVYTDNEPAIALYTGFGFAIEGTHRAYAFRDGRYVDAHTMARVRV